MSTMLYTTHAPCLVAIAECTHVRAATASFGLGNNFQGAGSLQTKKTENALPNSSLINTHAKYERIWFFYTFFVVPLNQETE